LIGALFAAPAVAKVQPYGHGNYGYFNDVLPPGANGLASELNPSPSTANSQLSMYDKLTTAAPNITQSQIGRFYKSSIFGVKKGHVAKVERPESGVTIEWDRYGVPHIYGNTRAALMFGIGWATAEDRLFFIDALRHAGQGDLASFAGGSNAGTDESVWASEPYTHTDLRRQVNYIRYVLPGGQQVYEDALHYVAGINAYIHKAQQPANAFTMLPVEYTLLGKTPQRWTVENLVSIATLVGGIFGEGGGTQLQNAQLLEQLSAKFGQRTGASTFMSFDDPSDPTAPTTVKGKLFRYQSIPRETAAVKRRIAMPDRGSVAYVGHVSAGALPAGVSVGGLARPRVQTQAIAGAKLSGLLAFPRSMSNALLVSAKDSTNHHPLVVMGPQVGYFSPQILMEEDIHGPGIDAAGAAFTGVNLYVELGHGPDYAWSATSSGQNIVDTFAVPLCSPSGGKVSTKSRYYLLHGRCVKMQTLLDHESWKPNLADETPAGSVTFSTERTAYGIVIARARSHGRPVVYCNLRSTYLHELDSAVGFEAYNDPKDMRNAKAFYRAAAKVDYTFNWFYANNKQIAYYNSGQNPVRAAHTDPLFPTWDRYAWPGYAGAATLTPQGLVERDTSAAAHPHVSNQSVLTSWNNKQARGYNDAATGQEFSSIYRSQLLNRQIDHYLHTGNHKLNLADLIDAMGNAGTQDLRGVEVLPYALKVVGQPSGAGALSTAVSELTSWMKSGAHRINRLHPAATGSYQDSAAIRIMDAWWPLLVKAEFGPVLGQRLLADVESDYSINDPPSSHQGSAWDVGFYGIVQEDLRAVLNHDRLVGGMKRVFCGAGSLSQCRTALRSSLLAAAALTPDQVYPAEGDCMAGDQMCTDAIRFRAIGELTEPDIEWVNRPTFQQADTITGHMR
jgi:acyl-homoserine lactone acylase PvdQ